MFTIVKKEMEWGGRPLTLETGRIARQADGAVLVTYGATRVLCTAVYAKTPKTGIDFFPLTVNYQEKTYAAGRIPGGFFKREARPSEKETLTSRLIDRPIRPLFIEGFTNEVQVVCTVLEHDMENDPDMVALIGASAALTISGAPFKGPIAGVRVGYKDGSYILNPTLEELKESALDLVVSGTRNGVLMVESEAQELSESVMLGAVTFGHEAMQGVIDLIISLAQSAAKEPYAVAPKNPLQDEVDTLVAKAGQKAVEEAYAIVDKKGRRLALDEAKALVLKEVEKQEKPLELAGKPFKNLEKKVVRGSVLKTGSRIDGRGVTDIRPIECETGVLERTHGSALFTRGETQALVVATLGTAGDEQIIDSLAGEYKERFLLHYNFPAYSVGEIRRMVSPGRREIGHGKLAWRAIHPLLPSHDDFPYTLRVVSEITESNGSSSMASVCGASMSLMDAGVPLTKPCAGIAMGLIKEGDDVAILSDIMGDEDHLGDMDFKVAGTCDGITALQMDLKITSITVGVMEQALAQAKDGRLHILGCMDKAIGQGRDDVSQYAPRIITIQIPREKIRDVIGTGGKVIREICETLDVKIDIEEDGTVHVSGIEEEATFKAKKWIEDIVIEPEVGAIYQGEVVRIEPYGGFVNFIGKYDGLLHISEISDERIESIESVLSIGQKVWVKCVSVENGNKYRLSMRMVNQETGEQIPGVEAKENRRPTRRR